MRYRTDVDARLENHAALTSVGAVAELFDEHGPVHCA
jgi:hypothetical protein